MTAPLLRRSSFVLAALLCAGGCQMLNRGDQSYVTGLRVLAIKAEPPEVAAGQTTTLTALAVDTMGRQLNFNWTYCDAAPPSGSDFNTDCVTQIGATPQPGFIHPFGTGLSAMMVMPMLADPTILGSPDRSGGVYLPVGTLATAGTDTLQAVYHLRTTLPSSLPPANKNPTLAGLYQVMKNAGTPTDGGQMDGGSFSEGTDLLVAIDPATPLVVHNMQQITLRALFTAASSEMYMAPGRPNDAGMSTPRMSTESLDVSIFSTAGTLSDVMGSGGGGGGGGMMGGGNASGNRFPDTLLTVDNNLPAAGGTIDVWVVGRDNRGGTDYLHRTLTYQP